MARSRSTVKSTPLAHTPVRPRRKSLLQVNLSHRMSGRLPNLATRKRRHLSACRCSCRMSSCSLVRARAVIAIRFHRAGAIRSIRDDRSPRFHRAPRCMTSRPVCAADLQSVGRRGRVPPWARAGPVRLSFLWCHPALSFQRGAQILLCSCRSQAPSNNFLHDLVRAAVDLLDSRVGVDSGDRVLLHVAVATKQL
jgi:hypothetical protein